MKNNNIKTAAVIMVCISVLCIFFSFYGSIEYSFEDSYFSIHTGLWKDHTVPYDNIEKAELRSDIDTGKRVSGYGSAKLNLGTFQNAEFDKYTLYSYANCETLVILQLKDGTILAVSGEDRKATEDLYDTILKRLQ